MTYEEMYLSCGVITFVITFWALCFEDSSDLTGIALNFTLSAMYGLVWPITLTCIAIYQPFRLIRRLFR